MSSKLSTILDKMMTTETCLVDSVKNLNEDVKNLNEDLANKTFQNFSMVDAINPAATGVGVKTNDTMASNGVSYQLTTPSTVQTIFSCDFTDVKFGSYALCARMRVGNNTYDSNILTLKILRGSTELLSKTIKCTDFTRSDNYCLLCANFNYDGTSSAKQPLTFKLDTTNYSGVKVYFDYAYISLITPAVYA